MAKEATIYDIAAHLNISAATVSRALNNKPRVKQKTIDKVKKAAGELGYRHNMLASNLRRQKSKTIGLLLHELNSNFVTSVLSGIEKVATAEGYDLLIAHSAEDGLREIANAKNIFSKRVDGLIASLALGTKNIEHFTPFFERKIPVVFFDRVPDTDNCIKVVIDNYKAGYDATAHLIQNGYRHIAHITAELSRNVYNERYKGYKSALQDHHLPFDESLISVCSRNKEDIVKSVNQLLEHRPDAFFITNDFAAAVCMAELKKKGLRVPDDIGVFGFNNDILGDLITPLLSTVDYPGSQTGEAAARELFNLLKYEDNKETYKKIIIPSKIIIRESSVKHKR